MTPAKFKFFDIELKCWCAHDEFVVDKELNCYEILRAKDEKYIGFYIDAVKRDHIKAVEWTGYKDLYDGDVVADGEEKYMVCRCDGYDNQYILLNIADNLNSRDLSDFYFGNMKHFGSALTHPELLEER